MDNLSILLAATWDEQTLKIRIDHNGLAKPDFDPNPVETLVLESCDLHADFQDALTDSIHQMIEYKVNQTQEQYQIFFWFGYKDDEYEVLCKTFISNRADYTIAELQLKCERLGESYLTERRLADVNSFLYRTLLDRIQTENRKSQDVCQRKIEFFTDREPEKAEHFREILKVAQKQLSITGIEDQQDLRNKIRILFSQMYDEDGFEYHKNRNKEIRDEIVNMGDAAILPLLEDLQSLEPSWRTEILTLMERINPKIYANLLQRTDLF